MAPSLEIYKEKLNEREEQLLEDYLTFLKFKSVSTLPVFKPEMIKCSQWVKDYLEKFNFKAEVWETKGHPTIFAENLEAGPSKPTLLLYQHYDVQPVDPEHLWDSPPFEPSIKDGNIYARGASDNKGQAFYVFTALKLIMEKEGKFPLNIKLLVEGEEETGSEGLTEILDQHKKQLKADYLTVIDVDIPEKDTPAINMSCRGIMTFTIEVTGSNTDLHSGIHGGLVYNPLRALSEALAKMYDNKGAVTLPGFYDEVKEFSEQEKKQLYLDFDPHKYEAQYAAKANGGEQGYSPLERTGIRPTFEINGIWGGYNGEGFKTVLPAKAFAKLSFRLVANQNPEATLKAFKQYFPTLFPDGMQVNIKVEGEPAPAFICPFESKVAQAASAAYTDVFQKPCKKMMGGGSLPIAALLQKTTGGEALAFGLGLSSDKIHAPNEHFSMQRIKKGALIVTQFIEHLASL